MARCLLIRICKNIIPPNPPLPEGLLGILQKGLLFYTGISFCTVFQGTLKSQSIYTAPGFHWFIQKAAYFQAKNAGNPSLEISENNHAKVSAKIA